jgi:hypothetical protein
MSAFAFLFLAMCLHGVDSDSFTLLLQACHTAVYSGMVQVLTWHKGKQTAEIFHLCQVYDLNCQSVQLGCSSCAALASLMDLESHLDLNVEGQLENVPSHALRKKIFIILFQICLVKTAT